MMEKLTIPNTGTYFSYVYFSTQVLKFNKVVKYVKRSNEMG